MLKGLGGWSLGGGKRGSPHAGGSPPSSQVCWQLWLIPPLSPKGLSLECQGAGLTKVIFFPHQLPKPCSPPQH